jgi:hypothetical protein
MEVWSEGVLAKRGKEKTLHRDQTIYEMVEEVLTNQAKSLAERTGQAFESALEVVADTEAGQQLRELGNGEHRHKKARACYEPVVRMAIARWRKRQAKTTKCNPAKVAGSLS